MSEDLKTVRANAYTAMYGGLFGLFLLIIILSSLLPSEILGVPKFHTLGILAIFLWLTYVTKVIPRRPKCGMGLFSIIEIKHVPVVMKSWLGNSCSKCGHSLKNET